MKKHVVHRQDNRWQIDENFDSCITCNRKFTVTRRRHHCRICGFIFCDECSLFKIHKFRACGECYDKCTGKGVNRLITNNNNIKNIGNNNNSKNNNNNNNNSYNNQTVKALLYNNTKVGGKLYIHALGHKPYITIL